MVASMHVMFYTSQRIGGSPVWMQGGHGVGVFFVISGLVMVISARRLEGRFGAGWLFLKRRIIRIVPLYWAALSAKVLLLSAVPALAAHVALDPTHILKSYLFIPSVNSVGDVRPFLEVGWTLNLEAGFYAVIMLGLLFRVSLLPFLSATLTAAFLISTLGRGYPPEMFFYANPLVIDFLAGAFMGRYLVGMAVPKVLAAGLVIAGSVALAVGPITEDPLLMVPSAILPAFALVLGMVWLEPLISRLRPRPLLAAGDASYALYLVHPFVGLAVVMVLTASGITSLWFLLPAGVGASMCVALAAYRWIEKPLTAWLMAWGSPAPLRASISLETATARRAYLHGGNPSQ